VSVDSLYLAQELLLGYISPPSGFEILCSFGRSALSYKNFVISSPNFVCSHFDCLHVAVKTPCRVSKFDLTVRGYIEVV